MKEIKYVLSSEIDPNSNEELEIVIPDFLGLGSLYKIKTPEDDKNIDSESHRSH